MYSIENGEEPKEIKNYFEVSQWSIIPFDKVLHTQIGSTGSRMNYSDYLVVICGYTDSDNCGAIIKDKEEGMRFLKEYKAWLDWKMKRETTIQYVHSVPYKTDILCSQPRGDLQT